MTAAADRLLDGWLAGAPVGTDPTARRFAGRLVDAGVLVVVAPPPGPPPSATVVIPVRDRSAGLRATLAALDPGVEVLVVDDGSLVAIDGAEAEVVRRPVPGGPAAARNSGWRAAGAEVVAFIDADCVPPPGWVADLASHLTDPTVGAVAPRIRPSPGDAAGWLAAYEAVRSPLDLGPDPGAVRPGGRPPYVPSTALVVRRSALAALDGFDERLRTGEDVDLVWRLGRAGHRVRYDPAVVVTHPVRPTLVGLARQRFDYGRSAAPLAARHGEALAPLVADPLATAAWLLAGAGHGAAGLVVAAAAGTWAVRPLRRDGATILDRRAVARLVGRGQVATGRSAASALRRAWWPALAVAATRSRRARRLALTAAVVPALLSWWEEQPDLDLLRWTLVSLVDELAYGAGVWAGAIAHRRSPGAIRCLLPVWTGPLARRMGGRLA